MSNLEYHVCVKRGEWYAIVCLRATIIYITPLYEYNGFAMQDAEEFIDNFKKSKV